MFEGNPDKWTTEFLDKMRHTSDPYADKVIDDIFEHHEVETVNKVLVALINNDQELPEDLPPQVKEFFERTGKLPEWADHKQIEVGQNLFLEFSMIAFSVLGGGSLPECYSGAIGARVLGITGQLEHHVDRRILETIIMVIDVMSPGGLEHNGKGIRASQKVRLMHAAIRHLITAESAAANGPVKSFADVLHRIDWDDEIYGVPLNQETKGFTYLTFTYVILRSLEELDIKVAPERQKAFFHCWNIICHIMGVDHRFFVTNMEHAKQLWQLIQPRLCEKSEDGQRLTQALLDFMTRQINNTFFGRLLPSRHIPRWLVREFVSKKTFRVLGIKWSWLDQIGLWITMALMFFFGLFDRKTYGGKAYDHRIATWIFKGFSAVEHKRIGNRPPFRIPDHLT